MEMTFRWFGADDPIPLEHVRQIPGVRGVVTALYDVPVGESWPADRLTALAERSMQPVCGSRSSKAFPFTRTSSSDGRRAIASSISTARASSASA